MACQETNNSDDSGIGASILPEPKRPYLEQMCPDATGDINSTWALPATPSDL